MWQLIYIYTVLLEHQNNEINSLYMTIDRIVKLFGSITKVLKVYIFGNMNSFVQLQCSIWDKKNLFYVSENNYINIKMQEIGVPSSKLSDQ
jgi:hypothetical protein